MRRGERVNASAEQGSREFGLAARRDLPEGLVNSDAGAKAQRNTASEIFPASARRPARSAGAGNPGTQTGLKVAPADQGPCLYFGPSGERCYRRALRDGYCAAHLPAQPNQRAITAASAGPTAEKPYQRTVKVISVLAALLGFLAPLLENVIREILRWLHSH